MKIILKNVKIGVTMFVILLFSFSVRSEVKNIQCTIKGTVYDRPESTELFLLKEGENIKYNNAISIPIQNGKFEYSLNCDDEELYQLIFADENSRGIYKPILFIAEQGELNLSLYPMNQFSQNNIEGGILNNEFKTLEIKGIQKQRESFEELNMLTAKLNDQDVNYAIARKTLQDSIQREIAYWILQSTKEYPSIAGYSMMIRFSKQFIQVLDDISPVADIYQTVFNPKFPDHPYTKRMIDLFTGSSLEAGQAFIDVNAIDINGSSIKLSKIINGKPTILHLWASWCGPCRQKGKELIPIYEEFKDKGFTIVGIAREKNINDAAKAIKMDKYTWNNLVELNDSDKIWDKYGIGNAAGCDFLIDGKGKIVAISPSIEEIRFFLKNTL